ncbi:MAG: hypothetical protein FWC32_01150 [Firmicutes bacterium]|nr:hypothetical protein [Bacillota bacterium]
MILGFGDGMIVIENLTPILPPKERERRKREIEKRLYDVFSKYTQANKTNKNPNRQHCDKGLKMI